MSSRHVLSPSGVGLQRQPSDEDLLEGLWSSPTGEVVQSSQVASAAKAASGPAGVGSPSVSSPLLGRGTGEAKKPPSMLALAAQMSAGQGGLRAAGAGGGAGGGAGAAAVAADALVPANKQQEDSAPGAGNKSESRARRC